jgi:acetoacetyl-CoA synthetase
VRFGSAEIYTVTDNIPDIQDAICVGRRRPGDEDETVLLFVKPKPGLGLSRQLTAKIKAAVKSRFTPRHVPKYIFQVDDIPYTVNGKKCEINVKQVVNGQKAAIGGTVANPESITLYERYFHLEREVKRLENRLERL